MHFQNGILSNTLLKVASPLIPALVGIAILLCVIIYFVVKNKKHMKKMKKLYMSSEFDMELEAELVKKQTKSGFKYEKGYVPGKMPKTSYLNAERLGAPHEVVRVKETYAPSMELPEKISKAHTELDKKNGGNIKVAVGANPYISRKLNAVSPLAVPVTDKIAEPVLTPVPETPAYKMPMAPAMPTAAPVPPKARPVSELKKPVKAPAVMPIPPLAKDARIPDPLEYSTRVHGMISPLPQRPTVPPAKIVDKANAANNVQAPAITRDELVKEIKEQVMREMAVADSARMLSVQQPKSAIMAAPEQAAAEPQKSYDELKQEILSELREELSAGGAMPLIFGGAVGNSPEGATAAVSQDAVKPEPMPKAAMTEPVVKLENTGKSKYRVTVTETPVVLTKPIVVKNKKQNTKDEYQVTETINKPLEIRLEKKPEPLVAEPEKLVKVKKEKPVKEEKKKVKAAVVAAPRFDENCMLTPEEIYIDELPIEQAKAPDAEPVLNDAVEAVAEPVVTEPIVTEPVITEQAAEPAQEIIPEPVAEAIAEQQTEEPKAEPVQEELAPVMEEPVEKKTKSRGFTPPVILPIITKSKEEKEPEAEPAPKAAPVTKAAPAKKSAPKPAPKPQAPVYNYNFPPMPQQNTAPVKKAEPAVTIDPIVDTEQNKDGKNVIVLKVPEEFLKNSRFVFEDDEAEVNEPLEDNLDAVDEQLAEESDAEPEAEEPAAEQEAPVAEAEPEEEPSEHEEIIYSEPIEEHKEELPSVMLEEQSVYSNEELMPKEEDVPEDEHDEPIYSEPVEAKPEKQAPPLVATQVVSAPEENTSENE